MRTLQSCNAFAMCGLWRESVSRTVVGCAMNCAATVCACCCYCAVRMADCSFAPVAAVYGCTIQLPGFQTAGGVAARFIAQVRQPHCGRLRNTLRRYGWCVLLLRCPGAHECASYGFIYAFATCAFLRLKSGGGRCRPASRSARETRCAPDSLLCCG